MFLAISLALVAALYGYSGWRLLGPARLPLPWTLAAWALVAVLAALPHTHLIYLRSAAVPAWLRHGTAWLAFLSLGLAVITFTVVLVRDVAWLGWLGADLALRLTRPAAADGKGAATLLASPERRQFLLNASGAGALALSTLLCGYGLVRARQRPGVARVTVPIRDLPPAFEGFRIAQISDLHVGSTIRRAFVETVVDVVHGLDADIVAFTGDLADGTVAELAEHVEPLRHLRSRSGCYFATGNHEYYSELEPWLAKARDLGFDTLLNEHRVLERNGQHLVIGAITDASGGGFRPDHAPDPVGAMAGAPPGPRVMLAHQPVSAPSVARAGAHLVLSGHTHGGQFVPWKYVVPLQQPWLQGLHRVDDSCWVYVNGGTGYWGPPLRLGAPSEVTCIELTRA